MVAVVVLLVLLCSSFATASASASASVDGLLGSQDMPLKGRPTAANCTEEFFQQTIDHFNWGKPLDRESV